MAEQSVRVCCRVRPALQSESTRCCTEITSCNGKRMIQLNDPRNMRQSVTYQFDEVFTAASTQEEVFQREGTLAAARVAAGFPANLLAYGTAGSGKTHTLFGNKEKPGVGPQTVAALLHAISQAGSGAQSLLHVTVAELHQQHVFDVLLGKDHEVFLSEKDETASGAALSRVGIANMEQFWDLLARLQSTRPLAGTQGRHMIMTLHSAAGAGRLTLVDLAGNDDARKGGAAHHARSLDSSSVQHALSCLGGVIAALHSQAGRPDAHESMLTALLHDSMGQGSLTTLLTCIAPHPKYFQDTSSSLDFAAQARGQPEPVPALKTEAAARQAARLVPAPSTAAKRDKDRDTAGAGKGSFACMAAEMTASPILSHPALTGPPATGAMRGAPAGVFPQWSQPQSSGEGSSMLAYPSTHAVLSPKMKRPAMPLLGDTGKEVNAREVSHKKRKVVVGMETKAVTVSWEDGGMGSETSFQSLSKSGFRDNELSLADTPCQRLGKGGEGGTAMTHTGCTPSQERSMPEMPASLVKQYSNCEGIYLDTGGGKPSASHPIAVHGEFIGRRETDNMCDVTQSAREGSFLMSDVTSLWGPMTPIAANDLSLLSASGNRMEGGILGMFGTPAGTSHSPLRARDMHEDMDQQLAAPTTRASAQRRSARRSRQMAGGCEDLDSSNVLNLSGADMMLTPMKDMDMDLRLSPPNSNAWVQGQSPYGMLPDSVGVSTRKRTSVFGASAHLTAQISAPGQVGKMQAAAEQEEPLELNQALQLCGGVDGAYHRHLVAILNTANMSRLCSLKGIGKQRARKLVEMRQMQPHMPLLTHVQQLASIVGMTSKQIDKFFADNALAA